MNPIPEELLMTLRHIAQAEALDPIREVLVEELELDDLAWE